jgi:acetate kinase
VFEYSCKKYLGAYAAALGGVDCVVFTAGIGEHDHLIREHICKDMEYMGLKLDEKKNENIGDGISDVTAEGSKVKILVIPTNEELVIARDTERLAK